MSAAATLRRQIEAALAARIPSALTPMARVIRPVTATGVAPVDELLEGGLPVGAITEMVGAASSGRTSLALSFIARRTGAGNVCAWVDVWDGLDPESAAAAGIDLKRLLWVRCGVLAMPARGTGKSSFQLPEKYGIPPAIKKGLHGGGFGPHPRTETKGLSEAVGDLLRPQSVGPRCAEPQPKTQSVQEEFPAVSSCPLPLLSTHKRLGKSVKKSPGKPLSKPWTRIEQALRSVDLLLQAGGFAAVVLDMADIPPEYATRVPLATWFRYRAAVERAQTSLLLLTQHPCAKSSAELVVRFQPGRPCGDEATVFTGIEHRVEVDRKRFSQTSTNVIPLRKPPQREGGAHWRTQSAWAGGR